MTNRANILCNANKSAAELIRESETSAGRPVRAPYSGVIGADLFQDSDDTSEQIGPDGEHVTEYIGRDSGTGETLWHVCLHR